MSRIVNSLKECSVLSTRYEYADIEMGKSWLAMDNILDKG